MSHAMSAQPDDVNRPDPEAAQNNAPAGHETHETDAPDALAEQITGWRTQGAERRDPVRLHRIEALALRSRTYTGEVRRVLDERLKALVDEFSQAMASAQAAGETDDAKPASTSPLAALTTDITQRIVTGERPASPSPAHTTTAEAVARKANKAKLADDTSATVDAAAAPPKRRVAPPAPMPVPTTPTVIATDDAFEDLDVLEYFRETWSKLSTDGNLRQSLAQVPENAGPLNSSHLVHRALSLMHDVSPDYLRHFLRHADALSWLEDMETTGVFGNKSASRMATAAKPTRAKSR